MTIVLEHQFDDLKVSKKEFSVALSFKGLYQRVTIPFEAIVAFIDPGAKFGLSFNPPSAEEATPAKANNVVSLDKFRNKTR